MRRLIASLWARAVDASQTVASRIGAILGLVCLFAAPIVVLVMLVQFVHSALSAMNAAMLIACLWIAERFFNVIQRNRQAAEREKVAQQQMYNVISRRIAIVIIPAISQVTGMALEPEEIIYDLGIATHGTGFYYSTPRLLTESEARQLHRLIVTKLFGRTQIPRAEMSREKIILVKTDHIFIRNDPRIVQYFTIND